MNNISPGPRYAATLQLLRTADALWNASRIYFQTWDLSPSQFNILNLLRDTPEGITQVALSRELIMHRSNVTGLVDRLEKRGLLARRETPGDRRAYRVALTEAGRQLLAEILPGYYRGAEEVWGAISPAEATQVAAWLEQVSDHAQEVPEKLHP
jgi:DNA-binding MarR family transcriptional regulator